MTNGNTNATPIDDLPVPEFEGRVNPDDLETDGDNPNSMDDEMFSLLVERIRTRGWVGNAIVTDTDGVIADGEHRWKAAKELDLEEVPVKQYDLKDDERRLWRQELNKIHGEHDKERDALEFDLITGDDQLRDDTLDLLDAQDESLDEYLDLIRLDPPEKDVFAHDHDPDDLNVHFEDCVEGLREHVADNSVECVITDPPYGVNYGIGAGDFSTSAEKSTIDGDLDPAEARDLLDRALGELTRVTTDDAHIYIFANWRSESFTRDLLTNHGWTIRGHLVWVKENAMRLAALGNTTRSAYAPQHELILYATAEETNTRPLATVHPDVFTYNRPDNATHPTQKPLGLLTDILENSTTDGDTVLDPFLGSGSTAVAAIQTDRDYLGFELDADAYKPIIQRRIRDAIRANDASVNHDADADENASADADD